MSDDQDRQSQADDATLIRDPNELAHRGTLNGVRQFDKVRQLIDILGKPRQDS